MQKPTQFVEKVEKEITIEEFLVEMGYEPSTMSFIARRNYIKSQYESDCGPTKPVRYHDGEQYRMGHGVSAAARLSLLSLLLRSLTNTLEHISIVESGGDMTKELKALLDYNVIPEMQRVVELEPITTIAEVAPEMLTFAMKRR